MFKILKLSQIKQLPFGKELLNEDLKQDDLNKILKYTQMLTGNSQTLVESQLVNVNFNEFVHTIHLLENQKALYYELRLQPLIREGFEEIQACDVNDLKDYLEKIKKVHQKIKQIYDFEIYELDPSNNLRTKDVQELIDSLKMQHDFIYETEQLYKIYVILKGRIEIFCNQEFIQLDQTYNCFDLFLEEFDI